MNDINVTHIYFTNGTAKLTLTINLGKDMIQKLKLGNPSITVTVGKDGQVLVSNKNYELNNAGLPTGYFLHEEYNPSIHKYIDTIKEQIIDKIHQVS